MTRYIEQRVGLGDFALTTARATNYMLTSWLRHVRDWRTPSLDELVEWVMVPRSRDGKHRRASCVRTFYRWAHEHGWLPINFALIVPKVNGSEKKPKPIPDDVLADALARACQQDRDAIILGRFAGLRASEIAAAHRDHLGRDGRLYVLGKGQRERWVEVHSEVKRVMLAADGFVFGSQDGQTMSKRLGKALPPPWTAHCLRHAFGTELYARTRDLVLVAEQMGHKSTTTTERYVLVRDGRARAAVQAMTLDGDWWAAA